TIFRFADFSMCFIDITLISLRYHASEIVQSFLDPLSNTPARPVINGMTTCPQSVRDQLPRSRHHRQS
ncbi:MAG: hypothetical protein MJH10_21375, partial [Epibacterium sp.]|nr:hypothetical protein [Epibacterium sp.]